VQAPAPALPPAHPVTPAASIIAPFTDAHRALITKDPHGPALGPFLRAAERLQGHPSLMTSGDKDFIVRIQLSQMAAVGGQSSVQNYRGTFVHRARKAKEQSENKSPSSGDGGGLHPADALATRLRETICSATADAAKAETADATQAAPAAVELEHSTGDAAQQAGTALPAEDTSACSNAGAVAAAEQACEAPQEAVATEGLKSGLRTDKKFGSPLYASVHHPRRSICISASDLAGGEDSPEGAQPPPSSSAASGAPAVPSTAAYWRTQLAVEKAYEDLLELEMLTFRQSECHPLDVEKHERLTQERRRVLDRTARQLLGSANGAGGAAGGAASEESDAQPQECEHGALDQILGRRKGRAFLQRLFLCLAPPAAASSERSRLEAAAPALDLLWRLAPALLRSAPDSFWAAPSGDGDGWQRLRQSLAQSVEAACAHGGPGRPRDCAKVLAALLDGLGSCRIAAVCHNKSGVVLLRQLVEGCGGDRGPDVAAVEAALGAVIEEVCAALPQAYAAAAKGGRGAAVPGPPGEGLPELGPVDDQDLLNQEDLWAMLIAVTEQSTLRQKRRIHELIGNFVSEVTSAGGE